MSRVSFTDDLPAASRSRDSFPKLTLEQGERARVALLETPFRIFVHSFDKALIINGKGRKITKERADKTEYSVWETEFFKSVRCLGEENTLAASGVDVTRCPACKASAQYSNFRQPTPKYGMNVVKYAIKPNGFEVQTPFQVSTVVWTFGPQKFEVIRQIAKNGFDLTKHDLLLGPCINKGYQKFEIMVSGNPAEWSSTADTQALTAEMFNSNKEENLAKVMAASAEADLMQVWVDEVKRTWDIVNGVSVSNTEAILSASEVPSASSALSGIRDDSTASTGATAGPVPDFDSLLAGLV